MTIENPRSFTRLEGRALHGANFRARAFWLGTAGWIVFFFYPLLPGFFLRRAWEQLQYKGLTVQMMLFLAAVAFGEGCMLVLLRSGHSIYMRAFSAGESLMRVNVLDAQLANASNVAGPPSASAGDAVTRLRDDPHDVLMLIDNWVDVVGSVGYASIALVVLARIDVFAALLAVLPLILVAVGNRYIGNHIRRLRAKARAATSSSSDFLAAAFGASLTVKVSGARDGVLANIDRLNSKRSKAMVSDQSWSDALWSVNGATVDVCVGMALVAVSRRAVTAGQISLFASYAVHLVWLPQKIGGAIVGRRRMEVSAERLDAMLPARGLSASKTTVGDPLVAHRAFPVLGGAAMAPLRRPERMPLQALEVRGLTIRDRNISNVSFFVQRGTLTVISGPVGSGKSSLLRSIIGLLPSDSGSVLWNGERIDDRAAFFVPPQSAYVAQVPHLFSESLIDNILLGSHIDPTDAIQLAAFDDDVKQFADGTATRIGAGGVRLSGGQAQRAAAARALIHKSELLVFDDLTSALDVDTEIALWDRLFSMGATVLAVSNRPIALARASQVIALGNG